MGTHRGRYLRRTDLFLVRVWREGATTLIGVEAVADLLKSSDRAVQEEWSGSVQRVVDGEVRQFEGLQSLAGALQALLSETRE